MSFDDYEASRGGGRPVELYQFSLGGTLFNYTSAATPVTIGVTTYTPVGGLKRGRIATTVEKQDEILNIEMPADNEFVALFVGVIPGERATITIFQTHLDDPAEETLAIFSGFVSTVGFEKKGYSAKVACRPLTSASGRPMPRHKYQNLCNHMLYDGGCTLQEADFEETGLIVGEGTRTVVLAGTFTNIGVSDDYWEAGFIKYNNEFRLIVGQSSATMTLNLPFANSPLNDTVTVLPGCKHRLLEDCDTKFNNKDNYSGFPFIPTKNPFEGLD